jgi:D-threo-aldose 1-dehydrogenase
MLTPVAASIAPDSGFVGALPALVHFDYSHDGIMRSVEQSLARLQTDWIDILYVDDIGDFAHGPIEGARHMADLKWSGLKALNELKAQGVIGAWGLGVNETSVRPQMMAEGPLDVIMLAGRHTLLDRQAEAAFLPACRAQGVPLVIGGVLNSGILATGAISGARFNREPTSRDILARVAAMDGICSVMGSSLLSAALNFPLQDHAVTSVPIGASDPASLRQNLIAARQPPPPELYADTAHLSLR